MYSTTTMLLLTLRLQIFIKLILSRSTLIAKVTLVCTWILVVLARRPEIGPQVGVAWGTCPISKFRDPLDMSVSDEATLFKFGVHHFNGKWQFWGCQNSVTPEPID